MTGITIYPIKLKLGKSDHLIIEINNNPVYINKFSQIISKAGTGSALLSLIKPTGIRV